jgi:hypothetical protein
MKNGPLTGAARRTFLLLQTRRPTCAMEAERGPGSASSVLAFGRVGGDRGRLIL